MAEQALSRRDVLALLREHKPVLAERFGVVDLALFDSTSRGQARPDSDILVSFDRPTDPDCYFGVQFHIEDLLGRPVDLVTDKALVLAGSDEEAADAGLSHPQARNAIAGHASRHALRPTMGREAASLHRGGWSVPTHS